MLPSCVNFLLQLTQFFLCDSLHLMQIAGIHYTSQDAFAGSALHILHRGANYIVYIATAQETGLKLLLKAYDMSECCVTLRACRWHTCICASAATQVTAACTT